MLQLGQVMWDWGLMLDVADGSTQRWGIIVRTKLRKERRSVEFKAEIFHVRE